jgi:apolipoprotein N-acyltransferase
MPLLRNLTLTVFSALCLIAAFPKLDFWWAAWFGLVPLLCLLDVKGPRASFGWSYLCGLIFFAGVIYWIKYVTVAGAVLLVAYLALYFGLFGWLYHYIRRRSCLVQMVAVPAAWVLTEFFRSRLLTGFGWAALGLTQYERLVMIQIADIGGVYAVSFVLVFINLVLKGCFVDALARQKRIPGALCAAAAAVTVLVAGYGLIRMARPRYDGEFRTAVVQGNIDLETRWRETAWLSIIETYLELSRRAVADAPELIIWPETAFPAFLWEDEIFLAGTKEFAREHRTALLLGAVARFDENYYNAAILLAPDGRPAGHYFKNHLVPYGEYIPFRKYFPFLSYLIPIDDFTAGRDKAVLRLPGVFDAAFSVLICFEDTVAGLVRGFVLNGAEVLVNITNDAWFRDSKEPFMHLQSSVFRAVEYKRSVIRAANTGVSAFIDPAGRVLDYVADASGKSTHVAGYRARAVPLSRQITVYARFGDAFAFLCGALAVAAVAFSAARGEKDESRGESKTESG